jgi:hypothetical protein
MMSFGARLKKSEILAWYQRANQRISLRKCQNAGHFPRLSDKDVAAYSESVERHFSHLKRRFNDQLKNRRGF